MLPDLAHRRLPVGGLGHGEPFGFQVSAQHGADVRFVVHDEHLAHVSPPPKVTAALTSIMCRADEANGAAPVKVR